MKIILFGAAGGTGTEILKQALEAGHEVTAYVRDPARLAIQGDRLRPFRGDALDAAAVERALAGGEAVISALGPARPPVPGMMKTAALNIAAGMKRAGLRRLIVTTGAGVRDPLDRPGLADHVLKALLGLLAAEVLRDSAAAAEVIRASDLDWTIVRFPRLTDGPRTGRYRVGYLGSGAGIQVTRTDGADFILKELLAGDYIRRMPVISS